MTTSPLIRPVARIALVEDHTIIREALKEYIRSHEPGYAVTLEADHGKQLMNLLQHQKSVADLPDIVLLDISMPIMDGYETLQWLTTHYPKIRTVMLSMFSDRDTIVKCMRLGACAFLVKNVDGRELLHTVARVLEKGHFYSEAVAAIAVEALKEKTNPVPHDDLRLTDRELELLKHFCSESSIKEIAQMLQISTRTVDIYRDRLFEKLNIRTRVGLVMVAIRNELIKVENAPGKMNRIVRNLAAHPHIPKE